MNFTVVKFYVRDNSSFGRSGLQANANDWLPSVKCERANGIGQKARTMEMMTNDDRYAARGRGNYLVFFLVYYKISCFFLCFFLVYDKISWFFSWF